MVEVTRLHPAVIGGEPVEADEAIPVVDPSTGAVFAEVPRCRVGQVDAAVAAARTAFESTWRWTSPAARGRPLVRLAELIRAEADALARLESRDTGKPLRQARVDVDVAARYFEFYAAVSQAFYGEAIPLEDDFFAYTLHEPYGVVAHIIPWNYPLQIAARAAASLAAGNCVVLKPAEEAPLTSLRLGELGLEAGLPSGVLNVVPGYGEEAGAALAGHPDVGHLAFVGSPEVGRIVAKLAAENYVPVTLELGGKSPNIVFADADLDAAVPVIVNSIIQNAGQTCSAGSRLLVEDAVHDRLLDEIERRFASIRIGPGDEDPDLGPLISGKQFKRVRQFVEQGKSEARLVIGGVAPDADRLSGGFFWEPTLFDDVPVDAVIAQAEIFGPVLAAMSFRGLDDARELAERTRYGLVAAIWTSDLGKAHRLARELRVGQVYINSFGAGAGIELPFGGWKLSGHGRDKGVEALRNYTQTKTVAVRMQSRG